MSLNLALIRGLLFLKLLHKIIDLLFLLIENFVLLGLILIRLLLLQVLFNFFDVSLIGLNDLSNIVDIFFDLLDFCVILLDSVKQSLSGFGERQVHFVGLQLQVFLSLSECGSFLFQVLSSLLQGVLLQSGLGLNETRVDLFKIISVSIYVIL